MAVYLVSYDLNEPDKNYPALIKAIETYNANNEYHCKVLKSQWFLYSNKPAEQIFNHLRKFIDENDELFICEVNANCFGKFNGSRPYKWVDNLRRVKITCLVAPIHRLQSQRSVIRCVDIKCGSGYCFGNTSS